MSKKHFIALADAIREHNRSLNGGGALPFDAGHLNTLVRFCQRENPQFKCGLWLDYVAGKCGKSGGKKSGGKV